MTIFFRTQGRGCYLPGIVVEATELRPLESWIHLPRLVFSVISAFISWSPTASAKFFGS
jgi:hypothetical protein